MKFSFLGCLGLLLTLSTYGAESTPTNTAPLSSTIYQIPLKTLEGKDTNLSAYKERVLLIVNVASECGLTPQYKALEALQQEFQNDGLIVLGFPCNQFGGQEPGNADEIADFCATTYAITFPLFEKIDVNGPNRHPLYHWLADNEAAFPGDVTWNFGKFLVGRNGSVFARFEPNIDPSDPNFRQTIKAALAQKP